MDNINALIAEIRKTKNLISKNREVYDKFLEKEYPVLKNGTSSAMIISQIVTDFYTCTETLFHRISQYFGNGIDKSQWHKNLLANMSLEIPSERQRVISDKTASILDELLRFRHFRRYYFDTEYDYPDELQDALLDLKFCIDNFNKIESYYLNSVEFAKRYI